MTGSSVDTPLILVNKRDADPPRRSDNARPREMRRDSRRNNHNANKPRRRSSQQKRNNSEM